MSHPPKIVVDVDGVLAGPKPDSGYADCDANAPIIRRLQELKSQGWTITVNSSRNVKSFDHNEGRLAVETLPTLSTWLGEHGLTPDEVWLNKPWCGKIGVYVDDRAVPPSEFMRLNSAELLARVRGEAFTFDKPHWKQGTTQAWVFLDLRADESPLWTGRLFDVIDERRERGERSVVILGSSTTLSPGVAEDLTRRGALFTRFAAKFKLEEAVFSIWSDMLATGVGSHSSLGIDYVQPDWTPSPTLRARHFNWVRHNGSWVSKTSETRANQDKLRFEYQWLKRAGNEVYAAAKGYQLPYRAGGALSDTLLLQKLSHEARAELVKLLRALWNQPALEIASPEQVAEQHQELIYDKSNARLAALGPLLLKLTGVQAEDRWRVNGEDAGTLLQVVAWLAWRVGPPQFSLGHVGFWHGDFYPGNIVALHPWESDNAEPQQLFLIDPRGTINGLDLVLSGDRRYDLAKLAHSLRWGYDAITRGWRDVAWQRWDGDVPTLDVHLRVWDEQSSAQPQRRRVWGELNLSAGTTHQDHPTIHALAALQLITCAPLHSEDPERVIALIAQGLQAALHAGWEPS